MPKGPLTYTLQVSKVVGCFIIPNQAPHPHYTALGVLCDRPCDRQLMCVINCETEPLPDRTAFHTLPILTEEEEGESHLW